MSSRKNKPVVKGLMIAMSSAEVLYTVPNMSPYPSQATLYISLSIKSSNTDLMIRLRCRQFGVTFNTFFSIIFIKVGLYQTTIRS